jgi:hypothetical protein
MSDAGDQRADELDGDIITATYDAAFGDDLDAAADAREESSRREAARRALLNVEWDAS